MERIPLNEYSMWERVQYDPNKQFTSTDDKAIQERQELFGELQYYFDFVHPVLYDMKGVNNPIIYHSNEKSPKRDM